MNEQLLNVTRAIRALEELDCNEVATILAVLAAKMQHTGFGNVDIAAIDDAIGCIDGKDLADVSLEDFFGDVHSQLAGLKVTA
jgi:hypothetical protein